MSRLMKAVGSSTPDTFTANGARAHSSTGSALVDFFAQGGACRGQDAKFVDLFWKASGENVQDAVRILFYFRDVRGGQGERQTFRSTLTDIAKMHGELGRKIMEYIPEYGRWDDLFAFFGTSLEDEAIEMFRAQLDTDFNALNKGEGISLAAKWAPSANTSSAVTKARAAKIRKALSLDEKTYRKALSKMRKHLGIVETLMSSKDFDKIDYKSVPSQAMKTYRKAFEKRDADRFNSFLTAVEKGETKINASTLAPHELILKYVQLRGWSAGVPKSPDRVVEAQWKALPNYLEDNPHNGLVIADVSGSMYSGCAEVAPIIVSLALATYIAERNTGIFKDYFMTFESNPSLVKLSGDTLLGNCNQLLKAPWGGSTNIQAAFSSILASAQQNEIPEDEMPKVVYVVSDMNFNCCGGTTNLDGIRKQYESAGYELPKLVFWNVNASGNVASTIHDDNTVLISGFNPRSFEEILAGSSPEDVMRKVIDSERYSQIEV